MLPAFLPSIQVLPQPHRQSQAAAHSSKLCTTGSPRLSKPARRTAARMSSETPGGASGAAGGTQISETAPLTADFDHIALACTGDPEKLLSFYTGTLGFAPYNLDRYRAGTLPFPSARVSAVTIIDFFPPEMDGPGPGLARASHMCFAVRKAVFDALRQRLDAHEVKYSTPKDLRSGARGDAHTLYFRDPDGNLLEFRYYDDDDDGAGAGGA